MRFDGAIMVGVAGGTLDRIVLGWAAEEAAARNADLLVCHVREQREPRPPYVGTSEPAASAAPGSRRRWEPRSVRLPPCCWRGTC